MLSIHVLNAGKGDSIVLEHKTEGVSSYAVIDSNCAAGAQPPALTKLLELGADRLSFVGLTHPHSDHYTGLAKILEHFNGRIGGILSFPLQLDRRRLEALVRRYGEIVANGDLPKSLREQSFDLVYFLHTAKGHPDWHSPAGYDGAIAVEGFEGVRFRQVLPPARVKGAFFHGIDEGYLKLEAPQANELTLAIAVEYAGVKVLLGGDGLRGVWSEQGRFADRVGSNFQSDVVKIPHHGSEQDCTETTLDRMYRVPATKDQVALISANGNSHHPSATVLSALARRGVKPYCTNLAEICGGEPLVRAAANVQGLNPALGRFVASVAAAANSTRACQGAITYEIGPTGTVTIRREFNNLCAFRGDYAGLATN